MSSVQPLPAGPQIPVAVFLTRFEPGGTERQMIELIRRLDRARFRVHVACLHREGAWLSRIEGHATSIAEFPIRGFARPGALTALAAFARWCRREQIAVVQTCDLYANILGLPGALLARVPVRVGSRRELNPDKTAGQILLQRQAYRAATKVVANSSAARGILRQEGLAAESIAVISNGVDTPAWSPPPRDRRVAPTLITVANLRPEKNHEDLIAAVALLIGRFPDLRLQCVGGGPRRQALETLVRSQGLERHVSFLGHRDDVPTLLAAADLFVLPSRSEAFPNGVLEAMAAGLPVVASAVGGLLDMIESGSTGLLVDTPGPAALAEAVARLLSNPDEAARLGAAARAAVVERYSFARMVRGFEDLYLASLPDRSLSRAHRAHAAGA